MIGRVVSFYCCIEEAWIIGHFECEGKVRSRQMPSRHPAGRRHYFFAALILGEPAFEAAVEFFGGSAEGAAVVGGGDFPQNCVWGAGVDAL